MIKMRLKEALSVPLTHVFELNTKNIKIRSSLSNKLDDLKKKFFFENNRHTKASNL